MQAIDVKMRSTRIERPKADMVLRTRRDLKDSCRVKYIEGRDAFKAILTVTAQ